MTNDDQSLNYYKSLASFGFLCSYEDGYSDAEIESDLLTGMYQRKYTMPFEREWGGGLARNEQLALNHDSAMLITKKQIVETVFLINQKRNFDRSIVVGYQDIEVIEDNGSVIFDVNWRRLDDMTQQGGVSIYE